MKTRSSYCIVLLLIFDHQRSDVVYTCIFGRVCPGVCLSVRSITFESLDVGSSAGLHIHYISSEY